MSLGPRVVGQTLPHADHSDVLSMISGVYKRFFRQVPEARLNKIRRLFKFVLKFVEKNFVPLAPDIDVSFSWWLEVVPYPAWRKEELKQCKDKLGELSLMELADYLVYCENNSFMKDETYPEPKFPRGINSRSDEFKTETGPWFKRIEEVVYSHPYFIKHVPVADRPKYIYDLLYAEGVNYVATDYTAYESHFTELLMRSVEFVLYKHMTKFVPGHDRFWKALDVIAGKNVCRFKHFTAYCRATRMSGEMNTSLGNGFANLMFMLFLAEEKGATDVVGVVEGDDGLFRMTGPIPNEKDFEEIGLTIKIEVHEQLNTASFCGIIFDPRDLINVTDPMEVLVGFGWAGTNYVGIGMKRKYELVRAKSLSYLHQYPGCPIIQSLARYGLRATKHVDLNRLINKNRSLSMWEREQLLSALDEYGRTGLPGRDVLPNTRLLVERKYKIPVQDQIAIERYLDGLTSLHQLDHWSIRVNARQWWQWYDTFYVFEDRGDYPELNYDCDWGPMKRKYASTLDLSNAIEMS